MAGPSTTTPPAADGKPYQVFFQGPRICNMDPRLMREFTVVVRCNRDGVEFPFTADLESVLLQHLYRQCSTPFEHAGSKEDIKPEIHIPKLETYIGEDDYKKDANKVRSQCSPQNPSSALQQFVKLKCAHNKVVNVKGAVAMEIPVVKKEIEAKGIEATFPLPEVSSKTLKKVIKYCEYHMENRKTSDPTPRDECKEFKAWDANFLKDANLQTLYDLIEAASLLNMENLLELTCETLTTNYIKGKTPEEIRKALNIVNDYTPEEEAKVRAENAWAFEPVTYVASQENAWGYEPMTQVASQAASQASGA